MKNKDRYFPDESGGLFACRLLTNLLVLTTLPMAFGLYLKAPPVALLFSCVEMLLFGIALEVIQRCLKGFGLYTLAHLSALFFIFMGAPFYPFVHLALGVIASVIMYADRAMRRRDFYPTPFWLAYPVLIYIAGYMEKGESLRGLGVFAEVVLIGLFFVYRNQLSMERTFNTAKDYVRVPYRKIKMVNACVFGLFAVTAIVLALALSQIFNGEALVRTVFRGILGLYGLLTLGLFWLVSHLFPDFGGSMTAMDSADIAMALAAYQEEHPYLMMMWRAVELAISIVGIALFVWILRNVWKEFYREFRTADLETDDVRLKIVNEEDRKQERVAAKRVRRPGIFSPAARMRRMYVRYIRSHPGVDRIRPSHTPKELEAAVEAHGDVRIRELYERARYAPGLVTDEDVREMKRGIKGS